MLAFLVLCLPSCGLFLGSGNPADGEILDSLSPVSERDVVGSYATWRLTYGEPSDTDIIERTLAFVADHDDRLVVEDRETRRNGERTVIARVFGRDRRLRVAFFGAPEQLGARLRIIQVEDLMKRVRSDPKVKDALGDKNFDRATRHLIKVGVLVGEQLETIRVPAGSFQGTHFEIASSVLWVHYSDSWWSTEQPLPLTDKVKSIYRNSLDGVVRTMELARFGWTGAEPTLRLPDVPRLE